MEVDRDNRYSSLKRDVPLSHVHQRPLAKILHPDHDRTSCVGPQESVDITRGAGCVSGDDVGDSWNAVLINLFDAGTGQRRFHEGLGLTGKEGFSNGNDHGAPWGRRHRHLASRWR